jgi:hypothetical protein
VARKIAESKRQAAADIGDVAFVYGKDEHGLHILRRRSDDSPVEAGVIQPLAEGRPITGEVISLRPSPGQPLLFNVKTELPGPQPQTETRELEPASTTTGPSQVATDSYRKGWDTIWGGKRTGPRDLN